MAALALGIVQFVASKGTLPHRTIGWIWVLLMATVAASSFWIHQLRLLGPWSPIHMLSIMVLAMLPIAVIRAHRHDVIGHSRIMIGIFSGGLVVAGLFTLLPGRIMQAVIFGQKKGAQRAPRGGVSGSEIGPSGALRRAHRGIG
jgi:uncharacterized membrane protein